MPNVHLISHTPNPMTLLKTAASQCYQKEATDATIKHIIEAGHLSVLEHAYASFSVECSLTVLLQLTRHRHLSFTVQSSRGTLLSDLRETGILLASITPSPTRAIARKNSPTCCPRA